MLPLGRKSRRERKAYKGPGLAATCARYGERKPVSTRRRSELSSPGCRYLDLATVTSCGEPRVAPVDCAWPCVGVRYRLAITVWVSVREAPSAGVKVTVTSTCSSLGSSFDLRNAMSAVWRGTTVSVTTPIVGTFAEPLP